MADYDDIVERRDRREDRQEPRPSNPRPSAPPAPDINLIDLLQDENGVGGLASQLNPELRSKVLLPLANLLDKYGVSQNVASSPTTQNTLGLVSLLTDIAPVVKGLADYISGQQNKLADEDKAFLEEIRKAQESGEMADLFGGEDMMEFGNEVEDTQQEEAPAVNIHPIFGEMGDVQYKADGSVDWENSIDPDGSMREKNRKAALGITPEYEAQMDALNIGGTGSVQLENVTNEIMSMPSLEELAMSAGLTMEKVHEASSEIRGDNTTAPSQLENTDTPVNLLDEGMVDDMLGIEIDESDEEDEVVYLTDLEVEELEAQGFEMESLEDGSEEE